MPLVTITRQTLIQSTVYEPGDVVDVETDRYTALIEEGAALPIRRIDLEGIRQLIRLELQIFWKRCCLRFWKKRGANNNDEGQ